jgi:hypothetical protein
MLSSYLVKRLELALVEKQIVWVRLFGRRWVPANRV